MFYSLHWNYLQDGVNHVTGPTVTVGGFIPFGVMGRLHKWVKAESTPGWGTSSLHSPIWAFVGSVPCSRVLLQCSEDVLIPSCILRILIHTGAWTEDPPLLIPPLTDWVTTAFLFVLYSFNYDQVFLKSILEDNESKPLLTKKIMSM